MINDYFFISIHYLKRNKLRTFLTVLGVSVAIILIATILFLGTSLKESVYAQFESISPKSVFITEKGNNLVSSSFMKGLSQRDCDFLYTKPYVKHCTYMKFKYAKVEYKGKSDIKSFIGTNEDFFENLEDFGYHMIGNKPKKGEVVVGYLYSTDKVFGTPLKIGDKITVDGTTFRVSGFFEEIGNPEDDSNIYILDESFEPFRNDEKVNTIIVILDDVSYLDSLKKDFDRKKSRELQYFTAQTLFEQTATILDIINYGVLAIALISLVVGALGVSNTLFTSIYERTKDIGIMKALGAKDNDVFMIFIIETLIIMGLATVVGLGIAMLITKSATIAATSYGYKMPFIIKLKDILITVFFSLVFALVSSFAPAKQATKLNPIDAIRK